MSWARINLGDIAEFKNGLNFNKDQYGQGVKYISVADFKDYFSVKTDGLGELKEDFINASYFLKEGDILFVRSNGNKELVGRNLFIENTIDPLTFSGFCIRARFIKDDVLPKFYAYLFKSKFFRNTLSANAGGANINNLNQGILSNLNIPKPTLQIQHKIVNILSAYDELIENNLKRIKLLEEKAFLRYKSEFDFFKPSNEVNKVPEGWYVKRADEIFKIIIGKTPPREQSEWFNDEDSKVKWVSIKDINNSTVFAYETSETVTEMAVSKFNMNVAKAHTVLLSFKLTVGKVAITTEDMTSNEAIAHFNIEDEVQMCSEYIYFYLKNFPYDSLGSTSSIGTAINSKVVKAMPVLLPPKKVINDYKKDVEYDFNLIQNLLKQNTKLREARDILLPRLMSGVIEVLDK
jgi:type I restriction enzyme S subunit